MYTNNAFIKFQSFKQYSKEETNANLVVKLRIRKKECRGEMVIPFIRQIIIHRIIAQTIGSQFPRVPIVKVKGLKSHTDTE